MNATAQTLFETGIKAGKSCFDIEKLIPKVIQLAEAAAGHKMYWYQKEICARIVKSVIERDAATISVLCARQIGKTDVIAGTVYALAVLLPFLAKLYPDDFRLNAVNAQGVYCGFRDGIWIGIYAPVQYQAEITFRRLAKVFASRTSEQILEELSVDFLVCNGSTYALTNGSSIIASTASDRSKVEGETLHLLIIEEAQDVSEMVVDKSLLPFLASTLGTTVKIGTTNAILSHFYETIKFNKDEQSKGSTRNHFEYDWLVGARVNSNYAKSVEEQRRKLGETSDAFRMSYLLHWIFERGMFCTVEQLNGVGAKKGYIVTEGIWSKRQSSSPRYLTTVAGIDWGKKHDSTVVTIIAVDWENPVYRGYCTDEDTGEDKLVELYESHVIDWIAFHGDAYEFQTPEIHSRLRKHAGLKKIALDRTAVGEPMYERICALFSDLVVEGRTGSQPSNNDEWRFLDSELQSNRLTIPGGPSVVETEDFRLFKHQLLDLQKEYKNNYMLCHKPFDRANSSDDYCDSFRLAAWASRIPVSSDDVENTEQNLMQKFRSRR